MKKVYLYISKQWAKFYNAIPKRWKVAVYNITSTTIAGLLVLAANDLLDLEIENKYLAAIAIGFAGILNETQKEISDKGDKVLANEGDVDIIKKHSQKIDESSNLIKVAKSNL